MKKLLPAVALLCSVAFNAQAALITVEPDDFAIGTNISSAVAGVTLSVFSGAPVILGAPPDTFVYARTNTLGGPAPTGRLVFATSATTGFGSSWYSGDNMFRADFASGTDFVSIMAAADGVGDTEAAYFAIFDAANVLLDSITLNVGNTAQVASFTRAGADIAYLISSNPPNGPTGDSFLLDRLQFNQVPEPGTLALLGLGFAGLASARRRKQ